MDYVAKACQLQVGGGFDRGIKYFLENDYNTEQNCWQERQSHRVLALIPIHLNVCTQHQ